jgi:lysophospholipase L1-like esterase
VEGFYGVNATKPNIRARFFVPGAYDVTASVNSQRFRGTKEFELLPRAGVTRIAMVGDSMTFGWGANDGDTYPAQLERILANSVGPGRVEILNAGIGNVGTGEEAWWFDVWVKRFHPQVVVLDVFWNDVNDDFGRSFFRIDDEGGVSSRPMEELRTVSEAHQMLRHIEYALPGFIFLDEHSHLVNLLRRVGTSVWTGAARDSSWDGLTPDQIEKTHEAYRRTGLPLMAGEVAWLQERVQDSGGRLVVVYLPSREEIYSPPGLRSQEVRWKSAAIAATLKETCISRGIPFADLTPQVRQEAAHHPGPLYYNAWADPIHATPEGYRTFAEAVAAFLIQEGIVAKR